MLNSIYSKCEFCILILHFSIWILQYWQFFLSWMIIIITQKIYNISPQKTKIFFLKLKYPSAECLVSLRLFVENVFSFYFPSSHFLLNLPQLYLTFLTLIEVLLICWNTHDPLLKPVLFFLAPLYSIYYNIWSRWPLPLSWNTLSFLWSPSLPFNLLKFVAESYLPNIWIWKACGLTPQIFYLSWWSHLGLWL